LQHRAKDEENDEGADGQHVIEAIGKKCEGDSSHKSLPKRLGWQALFAFGNHVGGLSATASLATNICTKNGRSSIR
jgi:hypothetical protein